MESNDTEEVDLLAFVPLDNNTQHTAATYRTNPMDGIPEYHIAMAANNPDPIIRRHCHRENKKDHMAKSANNASTLKCLKGLGWPGQKQTQERRLHAP